MKVLILNTLDVTGGAAKAAYRLYKGLQRFGIDPRMIVQRKDGDDESVTGPKDKKGKLLGIMRPHIDMFPLRLYRDWNGMIFSPAILTDSLSSKISKLDLDIIHLHWVAGGFLRIENMKRLNKPILWTLHDSWAFTGGCHLPMDCTRYKENCGACPVLGSKAERDLSRWIWNRKKKNWSKLNLTVVTPSRWLAECAHSSSLFRDTRIEVIPNGIDLKRYRPFDKRMARELLFLPHDKKLILFGAMNSTSDRNKGYHLLLPAIQQLRQANGNQYELIIFGGAEPVHAPDFELRSHYIGRLHDEITIALLYAAADVFVAPSLMENLSNMVMESLACGTPCVAFNIGGMPDLIEHKKTGYLARPYEPDDLARGIAWVLGDKERWQVLSRQAMEKVENNYAIEKIAKRYVDLYQEILTTSKN